VNELFDIFSTSPCFVLISLSIFHVYEHLSNRRCLYFGIEQDFEEATQYWASGKCDPMAKQKFVVASQELTMRQQKKLQEVGLV
jgi:hypothetical protein